MDLPSADEGAERSCRQSDRLHLGAEFFRDVVHDEDENEEIESIDRPAEIDRQDPVALACRERAQQVKHVSSSPGPSSRHLGAVHDGHERSAFGRMQASRRPNQR
jgi:hypothetical protein